MLEKLNILMNAGKISKKTLSIASGVESDALTNFLKGQKNALVPKEEQYLFDLAIFLTDGMDFIEDDERLRGIIDVLRDIYQIDYATLSRYLNQNENILIDFMEHREYISTEQKYHIQSRLFMLYYVLKFPDYDKIP